MTTAMTAELRELAAKLAADALNERIDDAAFRRRARRAATRLQKLLAEEQAGAPRGSRAPGRRARAAPAARYVFVAVPNGSGGTTSVSIAHPVFEDLADALGGRAQVTALARKVAVGHRPESGVSRSAYVLRRLQQRAAKAAEPTASTARRPRAR